MTGGAAEGMETPLALPRRACDQAGAPSRHEPRALDLVREDAPSQVAHQVVHHIDIVL